MKRFADSLAAKLVKLGFVISGILPVTLVLKIGRFLGVFVYLANTRRRAIGYANIRAAFSKQKTPKELLRLIRHVYMRLAETVAEVLCFYKVDDSYIDKYITISGIEHFWSAVEKNKGVILLTAHFGNWELSGVVSSIKGFPLYVLARDQGMKKVNELLNGIRESKGSTVVRKGITTRYIVKALREGKIIGMVADQNAGASGYLTDFFGRPASTAHGPYRFASKTGAVILPVFMARIKGPYHRLILEKPIEIGHKEDSVPYVKQYTKMLESYVEKYPDQWLWLHRRWKACPIKRVVILSDGKAGHLNQSLALADHFKKYRKAKDISESLTEVEVIDVRFKNRLWKVMCNIAGIFAGPYCQGRLGLLKAALQEASYEDLSRTYADVVISTGFSLAAVNCVYKYENNAKNIACMRPGLISYRKFDMVVLPKHDVRDHLRYENVIVADTPPTLVDDKFLKKGTEAISGHVKRQKDLAIGVLLGGENRDFTFSENYIDGIVSQLLKAARQLSADLLLTTSRRTSRNVEDLLKRRLSREDSCKLLLVANDNNIPYAVGGILSTCDLLVASGESISMVSEAVASGKKTVIFRGERLSKKKDSKHDRFLRRLHESGCLKIAGPDRLSDIICAEFKINDGKKRSESEDYVYLNMWRLGA